MKRLRSRRHLLPDFAAILARSLISMASLTASHGDRITPRVVQRSQTLSESNSRRIQMCCGSGRTRIWLSPLRSFQPQCAGVICRTAGRSRTHRSAGYKLLDYGGPATLLGTLDANRCERRNRFYGPSNLLAFTAYNNARITLGSSPISEPARACQSLVSPPDCGAVRHSQVTIVCRITAPEVRSEIREVCCGARTVQRGVRPRACRDLTGHVRARRL